MNPTRKEISEEALEQVNGGTLNVKTHSDGTATVTGLLSGKKMTLNSAQFFDLITFSGTVSDDLEGELACFARFGY